MRILGFDTATRATAVAVLDTEDDLELVEVRDDPPPGVRTRHTTLLMTLIVETLQRARTSWSELDRIAVGVGPGTFTGLRIGVATARALGRAHDLPLVGVSTLESLAAALQAAGPAWLAVGDGAVEFREFLERSAIWIPADDSELHRVTAAIHCRLAGGRCAVAPEEVSPEYLRIPDAEINLRAARKR